LRAAGLRVRRLSRAGDVAARAIVLGWPFFHEALEDARWRPFRSPWSPAAAGAATTRLLPLLLAGVTLRESDALDDELERQALELEALKLEAASCDSANAGVAGIVLERLALPRHGGAPARRRAAGAQAS
jgi:hypothetical protein